MTDPKKWPGSPFIEFTLKTLRRHGVILRYEGSVPETDAVYHDIRYLSSTDRDFVNDVVGILKKHGIAVDDFDLDCVKNASIDAAYCEINEMTEDLEDQPTRVPADW